MFVWVVSDYQVRAVFATEEGAKGFFSDNQRAKFVHEKDVLIRVFIADEESSSYTIARH